MKQLIVVLSLWLYGCACFAQVQSAQNILSYSGVDPTGVKDSTPAMQSAASTGKVIYYPCGIYKFTSLAISSGGIVGDSSGCTILQSTDTTSATEITFTSTTPGTFRHFALYAAAGKPAGAGLYVTASSNQNQRTQIDDVVFYLFPLSLQWGAASTFSVTNSYFYNYTIAGMLVQNTYNPDSGDSVISNSWFVSGGAAVPGIEYLNSGGLKVASTKFNGGSYGLLLELAPSGSTSDLVVSDISCENETIACAKVIGTNGASQFYNVVFSGNQAAINPIGYWFSGVTNFYVGGGTISGLGNGSIGVQVDSTSSNGKIGAIAYSNVSKAVANNSATTFVERSRQTISNSITTATVANYGSLYLGAAYFTFPAPFLAGTPNGTPEVTCYPTSSGNGAISAYPTGITAAGASIMVIGVNPGASIPVTCYADGVI